MNAYISKGKLVVVAQDPDADGHDAAAKIGKLGCGLPDTLAYYEAA